MQRCAACRTELPAGANFCFACGRPVRAARDRGDAASLRAVTPPHLIDKILSSRAALEGERKQVTVLFADVKGSMELAEQLDPEEWRGIMERFFAILADGVHRFEGTVAQFTGDGIMALFGAPIAHEDHAQRACHAALELRDALRAHAHRLRRERGLDFAVRIGLNSGAVVVGSIGDDLHMDYTAQGHTVGLASRMEQIAEVGSVYVTEHTAALAEGFFQFTDLGLFTIKGVREPLRVYSLQSVGALRTRFDLSRARGLSRFVGRDAERQVLHDALREAASGAAPIVALVAEPGTGKSRLCFEFVSSVRDRGALVVEAHALAHARRLPFLPVRELLHNLFGIAEEDEARVAREKIAGRVLLLDPELRDRLPLVFKFLDIATGDRAPLGLDPAVRQERLIELVRRVLAAGDQPVVLLLEDLHWLDEGSEAFLRTLIVALEKSHVLCLLSCRPEYGRVWLPEERTRTLALPPLDAASITALLDDLLGDDASLRGLAARIRERTGGNPFFIEEAVNALVERGALSGGRGAYRLQEPLESVAIPASVEVVLAGRLDRLGERGKSVLQTAAVIGRQFGTGLLQRASGIPPRELRALLRELIDADFVHAEGNARFAFKHALTQEVAERSQLADARAARHAAVARAIEALAGERAEERAALLAHHWERGGDALAAAQWHGRAAGRLGGSDPVQALMHWRRARALLDELPRSEARDRLLLTAYTQIMEIGAAMAERTEDPRLLYDQGQALGAEIGDPVLNGRLFAVYATAQALAGDMADALQLITEAQRLAEQTDDADLRVDVDNAATNIFEWMGRPMEQLAVCERALALVEAHPELGRAGRRGRLLLAKGSALGGLGRFREARDFLRMADEVAGQTNDLELRGYVALERIWHEHQRGNTDAALAHAQAALHVAQQIGSGAIGGPALTLFGVLYGTDGDWQAAINLLESLVERVRHGRLTFEPIILAYLAEAYLGAGEAEKAQETAEAAVAAARRRGTKMYETRARMAQARVLIRTEGVRARSRVEALFASIEDLITESGARSSTPFLQMLRAELARQIGDALTCERELRAAREQFVEWDAPAMVAEVDARLTGGKASGRAEVLRRSRADVLTF